jgi:hypothetical protein
MALPFYMLLVVFDATARVTAEFGNAKWENIIAAWERYEIPGG